MIRFVRGVAFAAAGFASSSALAQFSAEVSGQVSLLSDRNYRGITLSDRRPEPEISAALDDPAGWFVGGLLGGARLASDSGTTSVAVAYGGLTHPIAPGYALEGGATYYGFLPSGQYNFGEVFVGVSGERWNARAYYSPSYFASGSATTYGELNVTLPVWHQLNFTGHVGELVILDGWARGARYADLRLGASFNLDPVVMSLAWVRRTSNSYVYPIDDYSHASRWVASASYLF